MNKVLITPNAQTGALITPFANSDYAYIQLTSVQMVTTSSGWLDEKRRSTLLRAKTSILEAFVALHGKTLTVPGHIVVREFLENELPAEYTARLNKNLAFEAAVQPFLKRAGKDGIALTKDGQRILRFSDYDPSGLQSDISVAHDNVSEVAEFRAAAKSAAALPEGAAAPF